MEENTATDQKLSVLHLFNSVQELVSALTKDSSDEALFVKNRLLNSVVRPLKLVLHKQSISNQSVNESSLNQNLVGIEPGGTSTSSLNNCLWFFAQEATKLSVIHPHIPELLEATAALQYLIAFNTDTSAATKQIADLMTLQNGVAKRIQTGKNGPYLATNMNVFYDWLGQTLTALPQMALCRCGSSSIKPYCDGTHATNGFTDIKDVSRIADKRDTYIGQQVTIFDNRGICQHSGFCTDRIASVFRLGKEPFVTPSGGRMDEIIRAVRDCPSGALSYAIDDVEARNDTDHHNKREPKIEVTKDGPYRITGGINLVDENETAVKRNEGSSPEHYALCRCGKSQNKPFCSGMHWYAGFHDPAENDKAEPTIFEWAGGYPAMLRMTRLFYEKYVPQDDLLAPLFATMSRDHPERVAKWLSEVFCGPPNYSKEYGGYNRMLSQHINKLLSEEQRARWVKLLSESAKEAMLPNDAEFRSAFGSYIEWGSRLAVENSQKESNPPQNMPMPHWDWHTAAGPPGSRVSALQPPEEEPEAILPDLEEQVSFSKHIKSLFRKKDRQSMSFALDLWSYADVCKHAENILKRVESGSMPCDGAWPEEKVEALRRWIQTGMCE